MNKNSKNTKDASTPYRSFSFDKITAPTKAQNEPKSRVIKASYDLRSKGGK